MASKSKLNVHEFPRPPKIEQTSRHLQIKWNDEIIADTRQGYWVLETHHAPTYYIPRSALSPSVTLAQIPNRSTYCEWKGHATYWKITHQPQSQSQGRAPTEEPRGKVWSYETPNPAFGALKGHLCFYVSDDVPWEGFVDGEKVRPQPGDYYGGWWTSDLEGVQKGGPGTEGW